MFLAFLIATAPRFSGLAIHEWLSLALAATIVPICCCTGSGLLRWRSRLNYLLNALLFVAFTVTIATGILISREALPFFGLTMTRGRTLELLHHQASDLTVLLLGLHVAIHWSWIVGMVRRILPQRRLLRKLVVATSRLEEVQQ